MKLNGNSTNNENIRVFKFLMKYMEIVHHSIPNTKKRITMLNFNMDLVPNYILVWKMNFVTKRRNRVVTILNTYNVDYSAT